MGVHDHSDDEDPRLPEGVITLLLTDVEGSTRAWEAHSEAMSAALARHDALVVEVVYAHRGLLIKSRGEGDATFSVFRRATDAALAAVVLQRTITAEPWPDPIQLSVRVAIHTGEAQLRDGDYFGTTVNRAARLRAVARGGEILCSQATAGVIADALPPGATLADLGAKALKDLSRPEHVFSLLGPSMVVRARDPDRSPPRLAHPFVGRAREVELVSTCLAEALAGHGGAVLVAGEPGIGKTRLAEQVEWRARSQDVPVVWGRCVEEEGTPTFWPWRQVLRACLDLSAGDLAAPLRADAHDIGLLVPDDAQDEDDLEGVRLAPPPGGAERFRLFEAVSRLIGAAATPAGLVVVLDDLQWADPSSAQLLAHLGRDLSSWRVLVVATYRDKGMEADAPVTRAITALSRERGTVRLQLHGLADVEVADQLETTFGRRFDTDVVAGVARRTGGNPFFVAELGRLLDDAARTGLLSTETWETALPESVRAVVAQRLGSLPPGCYDVLRTASVLGNAIDVETVAAIAELPFSAVLAAFDAASEAGLVVAATGRSTTEFSHALVRDALRADVQTARRLDLHRRAAEHIESTYSDDLDRHAAELAHHWLSALPAADAHRAVEWAERAAADARAHLAYEEAARLYQRALAAVSSGGFGPQARCRLWLQLAEALYKAGDVNAAIGAASEAGDEARRSSDPVAMARVALVLEGVSDEAWGRRVVELSEEALAELRDDHIELRARLMAATAVVYSITLVVDGPDRAEPLSREALALAETSGAPDALVSALRARQMACADPDGVGERLVVAGRMLALATERGDPWASVWGHLWRIEAQCQLGDVDAAEAELVPLAQTVERLRQPIANWQLARTRCSLAMGRGRFAEAGRYLDEATEFAHRGLDARGQLTNAIMAAKLWSLTGDPRYGPVISRFESDKTPGSVMSASTILALWHAGRGQMDRALEQYHRLPPWRGWRIPRFVALVALDQRGRAATVLDDTDGAAVAYERLRPWAGYIVVGGSALVAIHGSAQCTLGCLAACLGKTDTAVGHLRAAIAANARAGLPPFEIESRYELAKVLARRGRREDRSEALVLAEDAAHAAARLGMNPLRALAGALVDGLRSPDTATSSTGLTRRELEIAALVARGLTNRQIADVLHVAERTAENHVQHILTKLDFQNRAQIASWATSQRLREGTPS